MVAALLEAGAQSDIKTDHGDTVLSYATEKGHKSMLETLSKGGVRPTGMKLQW